MSEKHGRPFFIYRIIHLPTGKALVSGSNHPRHFINWPHQKPEWYNRGSWTRTGTFWRTEATVRIHLVNLCWDWKCFRERRSIGEAWEYTHQEYIKVGLPDWSNLNDLSVETTQVNSYNVMETPAAEFINLKDRDVA